MKLTIIGSGNMALALIAGLVDRYEIEVVARDEKKLQKIKQQFNNIKTIQLNNSFNIEDKNIILCVKPYSLDNISSILQGRANTLFSILAGTTLKSLKDKINSKNYTRVMPNLAALYGSSLTTITGDITTKEISLEIFSSIGRALWLDSENELDIATAIAGSGPAYLALVAESLADGGVKMGLKRDDSKAIVSGLFSGFASLIQNIEAPTIKDQVMSPAGTTACGVASLEDSNIRSAFIKSVEAAYLQAKELAKK